MAKAGSLPPPGDLLWPRRPAGGRCARTDTPSIGLPPCPAGRMTDLHSLLGLLEFPRGLNGQLPLGAFLPCLAISRKQGKSCRNFSVRKAVFLGANIQTEICTVASRKQFHLASDRGQYLVFCPRHIGSWACKGLQLKIKKNKLKRGL